MSANVRLERKSLCAFFVYGITLGLARLQSTLVMNVLTILVSVQNSTYMTNEYPYHLCAV